MSEILDLVRSIYADWERGDFSRIDWAAQEIEFVIVDGPERGAWKGIGELGGGWRDFLSAWGDYRVQVDECRLLDADRVLVLLQHVGRGKASGVEASTLGTEGANVLHFRDGIVTRFELYWDRDRALADLGLEE
jgi:ketosteroid isomerase-like protein